MLKYEPNKTISQYLLILWWKFSHLLSNSRSFEVNKLEQDFHDESNGSVTSDIIITTPRTTAVSKKIIPSIGDYKKFICNCLKDGEISKYGEIVLLDSYLSSKIRIVLQILIFSF